MVLEPTLGHISFIIRDLWCAWSFYRNEQGTVLSQGKVLFMENSTSIYSVLNSTSISLYLKVPEIIKQDTWQKHTQMTQLYWCYQWCGHFGKGRKSIRIASCAIQLIYCFTASKGFTMSHFLNLVVIIAVLAQIKRKINVLNQTWHCNIYLFFVTGTQKIVSYEIVME